MAEEWQPSDTDLQGIAQVLEQSQTADNAVHAQIQQTIMGMHANPDFGRYLVFIMCSQGGVPDELRALAGLILKENIRMHRYNDGCLGYVKAMIVGPLSDPHPSVRHFAGIVVTTIISYTDLNDWPAILPELASRLNGESPAELLDGAFSALDMICEDSHEKMDSEELGWPLNDLVPRLMAFIGHPTAKYRRSALRCLNRFIVHNMPQILVTKLDELLPALSELASDPDDEVRKEVCEALDNLMQARFDFMAPHMASIIEFFLQASQDEEPLVACQAIDFWSSYTDCLSRLKEDQQLYYEQLKDAFPRLIPLLVQVRRRPLVCVPSRSSLPRSIPPPGGHFGEEQEGFRSNQSFVAALSAFSALLLPLASCVLLSAFSFLQHASYILRPVSLVTSRPRAFLTILAPRATSPRYPPSLPPRTIYPPPRDLPPNYLSPRRARVSRKWSTRRRRSMI